MLFVFLNTEIVSNICSVARVHGNDNSKIRECLLITLVAYVLFKELDNNTPQVIPIILCFIHCVAVSITMLYYEMYFI